MWHWGEWTDFRLFNTTELSPTREARPLYKTTLSLQNGWSFKREITVHYGGCGNLKV